MICYAYIWLGSDCMEKGIDIKQIKIKKIFESVERRMVFSKTECMCCHKKINFQSMWVVPRFNGDETGYDIWNYCMDCLDSKYEVLLEIGMDDFPYGIYPYDRVKKYLSAFITCGDNSKTIKKKECSIEYLNFDSFSNEMVNDVKVKRRLPVNKI